MRPAIDTPYAPFHRRIKYNPVRRIHPLPGHALRRTHPGFPAILAAEEADVRCGNELPVVIERIEVIAVGGCNVEPRAHPSVSDRKSTRLNSSHSQISYAVF